VVSGAAAGVVAAAVWAAAEPLAGRVFRTPYSDVRLLGRALTSGRHWSAAGVAVHLVNGAIFGALFQRVLGGGPARGVAAAEVEHLALWPAITVVDRLHPDRRRGAWPPLFANGRVFVYEATMHALFGAVLGLLTRRWEEASLRSSARLPAEPPRLPRR
jgi:hypothetical protein